MASMKTLITTNPDQARQLLSSKPQLAYALFQAMLLRSIIDPSVLQRIQPIPANAAALPAPYPPAAKPFPYGVPPPQSQPPPSSYPSYPPAGAPEAPSPVAGGPGYRGAPPPSVAGGYNAGAPLLYNNLATARHNLDLLLGMVRLLQLQHHLLREWLGYRPLPRLLWQPFQRISRRCFFKCCSSLRPDQRPGPHPKSIYHAAPSTIPWSGRVISPFTIERKRKQHLPVIAHCWRLEMSTCEFTHQARGVQSCGGRTHRSSRL
ncbi:cleavage stimulation factor subunit 2 [Cryptococcus neoformans var. grubii Br795]|nr:cleavage stimulation factor subunit 2 [Cryptococcus neoformans var. grubii AD1-83a]OXC82234.1 cleavage stimulation factor subunit 2 [Cryptococcus neoformans var. grubii AD1-7a]OXG35761.1 cleavage stimulation factor subunit 2 [Cryptococcus neoformans var. grubii Bt120]OXG46505.1 cleavage stimulation factor subunit 2 [Cryptococcus neoformans var. grubii Th84]OXG50924.1 cleavage stimulation factor subunit 2 [Cryptococcus neoformans var. grubii MW-RSA1955]OXG55057.1 cleavage stimulation factor 